MFSRCAELTTLTLGENFIIAFDYEQIASPRASLTPSAACKITMNVTMYNAFKTHDLKSYTFSPNTWDASKGTARSGRYTVQ